MKKLYTLLGMVGLIAFSSTSNAQCPNDNTLYLTLNAASITTNTTLSTCTYGGEYLLINNMQAGATYTFQTCGDTDFDTQLTIFNNATGAVVAYNDDACGLQSSVTFTSDGSSVRISLDRFSCQNQSTCMTILGSVTAPNVNPCNTITTIACGGSGSYSLTGTGVFNGNGPFSTPGAEQIFSFTATTSGSHQIDVTHSGGGWSDLFFRNAASGCSGSGWTYIDDVLSTASNSVTLVAGVTYYFMMDDENTTASSGTVSITCPSGVDPCDDITDVDGCAVSKDFSLTGSGSFNNNGPWSTPGQEAIYSYTAPYSGAFEISISHTGGSYLDLFYRTAASGCSGSGWTYVDDILGSATNTINLVGGTTYYFMIDDENTSPSDGNFSITCPCIPSTTPDGTYTYNGDFVINGSTNNECNDCSLRPSDDQIHEIEILCAGTYTFQTCGGASWDTYLYLTNSFCGGVIASNDDAACGGGFSLQSSITANLAPGTYYISVEAFSALSGGDYSLAVSGVLDPIQVSIVSSTDVTCFGGNDGSASAAVSGGTAPFNFMWSDGQSSATASNLSAGNYTVSGSDANGCAGSTASVTISQPDEIMANITPQGHVIDCVPIPVDLYANPTGGTAPYTYLWSTGATTASISVNPNVTTTYSVAITDVNGCTENVSTNSTTVTVINRCGNNNQKSLICHVPNGNGGNPQTICISPNALNAHLSTLWNLHGGDYCGPCSSAIITTDNINLGDNSFIRAGMNVNDESVEVSYRLDYDSKIRIEIYDMAGVLVDVIFEGNANEGELYDLHLTTDKISSGVYIYQFITDHETHIDKLQIIQ